MRRRVVITGLGVVAPNGVGKEEFWKANIEVRSGVDYVKDFDVSNLPSKIAARVKDFDPLKYMPKEVFRRTDRFVHFGIAASIMALEDSGLDLEKEDRDRIGAVIGSGLGGVPFHEEQIMAGYQKGINRLNPLCVPKIDPNSVSSHIAITFNVTGPNMVISTACASGTHAIGQAFRMIQDHKADIILSGGAEAPLTPFTFGAYCALHVLSTRNDSPQEASRPFDRERDGFVLGEGAGILILEELSHALRRNAHIYAEIIGYGSNSGAYHMVMPEVEGMDRAKVMKAAIKDADISPQDIDYISAYGNSTQPNDKAETKAIKWVFNGNAYNIPVSSIKSMIGHTVGASGAIEAVSCSLALENNIIPPTINYKYPDPDCDLDYVPNKARKARLNTVLLNSFGVGNNNACVVIRSFGSTAGVDRKVESRRWRGFQYGIRFYDHPNIGVDRDGLFQLLDFLEKNNPVAKEFLLRSFHGLPVSPESEEETCAYFAANSSISTAVLTNPGGSIISELLYERKLTPSPIDRYFLQSKAGRAVKARLIAVEEKLPQIVEEYRKERGEVLIGNLGSGHGIEVIDVFASHYRNAKNVKAIYIDVDEVALRKGKRMAQIKKVDHLIKFTRADFTKYVRHNPEVFDIVLLIGVICPFDAAGCVSHLQLIKRLLKPGGCLIASNVSKKMFEEDPFTYHIMAQVGKWQLVFKDRQEFESIFREAGYIWRECFTDAYGFHLIGIGIVP